MQPPRDVILYTRHGCHLCDLAHELLVRYKLIPREVDIDSDPELAERFGDIIPVVEIDGKIRFRGRIDETLLRRLVDRRG